MSKQTQGNSEQLYLLRLWREGEGWRLVLKTAVHTHTFATLEELALYLAQTMNQGDTNHDPYQ